MNKRSIACLLSVCLLLINCSPSAKKAEAEDSGKRHIIANPLNLNYRFQFDEPSRREAADPVCEYFNGKYYLFASKSGGYWSSVDMADWSYIPCKTISNIEDYAPAILVHNNAIYYMGSGTPKIFKNENPDTDHWEEIDTKFRFQIVGNVDPAFFKDDDGKVYIYWGCSSRDPIIGVQVDPENGFQVVNEAKILIEHNYQEYGWEVPGEENEKNKPGYNEGPCMIKYNGKYYLQYAAPGTEFRVYGDGVYVADSPLGPYTYEENSPFSFKPGGFIGGAGHGHTFLDKYGNYWHVATMKISVRHMFERRIGLFPTYLSENGRLYTHTLFTDYPFYVPDRKTDFETNDCSLSWNLLSRGKRASASSSLNGYEAEKAADEMIETWWSAGSGNSGEWWQIDLGKKMTVHAVQVNFADHDFTVKATDRPPVYQYYVEYSHDGKKWNRMTDRSDNEKDQVHELIIPDKPLAARYIKIINAGELDGKFSLYDLRVFGHGGGQAPAPVTEVAVDRDEDDRCRIHLDWPAVENATGYIVRWGVGEHELNSAEMVYTPTFKRRFFNRDTDYWFAVDAFNENGVTGGADVYKAAVISADK
ncbi:MAG: family 43 glycosylhydrolase [Tannerella sp.]|nr:family 43 glycosylhydrolase [Tannerella sp.]